MTKTIEVSDIDLRALVIQKDGDGNPILRADYDLLTSEGTMNRSKVIGLTDTQVTAIKTLRDKIITAIKLEEGMQ